MGWMVEVVIALVLIVLTVWLSVYLLGARTGAPRDPRSAGGTRPARRSRW